MTKVNSPKSKIFSGQLHPGLWILGVGLLTAGIHNALEFVGKHSIIVPLAVGGVLGCFLYAYTKTHRRQLSGLHRDGVEVKKREAKYRTFFENSTDAMLMIENGEFVDCNDAAVAMLGYNQKEEVIHLHPAKLSPEFQPDGRPSAEKADEMMRTAEEQGSHRFEWNHLRKDGTVFPVAVSLTAIETVRGMQLHTVWRDLTQRKRVEDELLRAQGLLRSVLDHLPIGVAVNSVDPAVEFDYINDNFIQYYRTSREALAGPDAFWAAVYEEPEFREEMKARVLADCASGDPAQMFWADTPITRKGEATTFISARNTPIQNENLMISTVWDVTKHKIAEEALRTSEGKYRGLVESSSDWIWEVDADGRYSYASPQVETILGYAPEELIGKMSLDLMSPDEAERIKCIFENLQKEANPIVRLENVNLHRDGHEVILETSGVPIFDSAGRVVGYRGIDRDITERKLAERERKELEDQLRQAQKMEAVGQMAGGIAHDFNNLLQVIGGYAELLQMNLTPDDPVAPAISEIGKAALRGKNLINQLLAFSRRQVIRPTDLDLNETIHPLLNMIRGLIGEDIELEFIEGRNPGVVYADHGLIGQVLMNLCVNARDAMPEGGKLTIETENVLINSEYVRAHSWSNVGRYVLLSVTDTGCGMDRKTLAQIFEPFFTTKEVGKGTGLGLSMAFGIIKQHGGHITAYSEVGKGTIFKVYFPTVERHATEVSSRIPGPVVGGTETILVVEDDELVLKLAEQALNLAGYTVLTGRDGVEALQLFEKYADKIDLVIMDVVMPRMGGKEAMDRILKLRPGTPYIFSSGYSENAVHTNFIQKRGLHLLSKPYQNESLLRTIREVLGSVLE